MAKIDELRTDPDQVIPPNLQQTLPGQLLKEEGIRPITAALGPVRGAVQGTHLHIPVGSASGDELLTRRPVPEPPGEITPQETVQPAPAPGKETRPLRAPPPRTTVLNPEEVSAQLAALRRPLGGLSGVPSSSGAGGAAAGAVGSAGGSASTALSGVPSSGLGQSGPSTSPSIPRPADGTLSSSSVRTSGLRSTQWSPSPELSRTIGVLAGEELGPAPEVFLSPDAENPFEGMLNATLELKLPPPPREGVAERSGTFAADLDQVWLGPPEPPGPRLANSFGLSDEQVSRQFATLYQLEGVEGDVLLMVGVLGRLEGLLVQLLGQVGHEVAALIQTCRTPEGVSLRGALEPSGLLTDADILWALQLWQENRHEPRFWADDDGARQKAARLVGYQVARKRLEPLRQLRLPAGFQSPTLTSLLSNIGRLAQLLGERQNVLRQHFPSRAQSFNAGFLVQRGLNAQWGFFWLQQVRDQL